MSTEMRIDFIAPPFAGHLYPLLDLASQLRSRGWSNLRFLSTPEAASAVKGCGFPFSVLLSQTSHVVTQISDTQVRIGSNPLRLLKQLRMNLSLMDQLCAELEATWLDQRPDLLIADLTLPIAGLKAQSMGIGWWSSLPTLCVLETGDGVPSYVGGWRPISTPLGRARDRVGRKMVSLFKWSVHRAFQSKMQQLGLPRVYRPNGLEAIYSDDAILGLGVRELEFPRSWPSHFQFIGPLVASPPTPSPTPYFEEGKSHVLVSLGTHLWWAKEKAEALFRAVAQRLPNLIFHFTRGKTQSPQKNEITSNFQVVDYLPYDRWIDRYQLVVHHGGTGVMYACLRNGVPSLVWPQDYDQFDHAARLVHHGLGRRCRPKPRKIAEDIQRTLHDQEMSQRLKQFQKIIASYHPGDSVAGMLQEWFELRGSKTAS